MAKKPGFYALQKLIFQTLSAATTVIMMPVLDYVNENQAFPYITIGEDDFEDDGNKTDHSDVAFATINVWSRAKGFSEVKSALSEIINLLSDIRTTIDGYHIAYLSVNQMEIARESDGITRSGTVRLKFMINQN